MKLFLLFTVLSIACYGQRSPDNYGSVSCYKLDTPEVYTSNVKIDNESTRKHLSLEEKLLLYAQECYNDSTLQQVPYVCFPGCMVNHYPEWKYIHREPTFQGFIEWLRKQK